MSARNSSIFSRRVKMAISAIMFSIAMIFFTPGIVDGEPYYTHNGQAFFPISTYRTPWANDQLISLQELHEAGINVVHMYHSRVRLDTLNQLSSYNMTARCYINALVRDTSNYPVGVPAANTVLGQFIAGIAGHSALYDYENTDEAYWHFVLQDWSGYPPYTRDQLIRAKDVVLAIDPNRKIMCNFADHIIAVANGCTLAGFQSWKATGTSWGMDIYPIGSAYPNNDLNRIGNGCEYVKSIIGSNQPFTMILQAAGVHTQVPDILELRFMVFTAIIHGAKGITWYDLPVDDLTDTNDVWQNAKTVSQELSSLKGPLTTGITDNSTRNASAGLEYTCKTYNGVKYLIIANRTANPISNAYINISDWSNNYVQVLFHNQVKQKISGNVNLGTVEAWGVRVLRGLTFPMITSPTPGSTLSGSTVTFSWTAGSGIERYALDVGTAENQSDIYDEYSHTDLSRTVPGIPTDGSTIWVRLSYRIGGVWYNDSYTYTAFQPGPPVLYSPTPGTTLSGSTVTFKWTAGTGVERYAIDVGTSRGASDIYDEYSHTNLSRTVSGIPIDGSPVWVRLCYRIAGSWYHTDYQYTALTPVPPVLTTPTPGSTLSGSTVTFSWTPGVGVERYAIDVGSSIGASDIYDEYSHTSTSRTVSGIPTDGRTIWVRLCYRINGMWSNTSYSYTAKN